MDQPDLLMRLPQLSLMEILENLHGLARKQPSSDLTSLPTVELLLGQHREVGQIVFFDREKKILGMASKPTSLNRPTMAYLQTDHIIGLHVEFTDKALMALAPSLAELNATSPPSRFEIQRQLTEVAGQARSTINWAEIPEDPIYYAALGNLVRDLVEITRSIRSDEMGREALAGKVDEWVIKTGNAASASLLGRAVTITVALDQGVLKYLDRAELKRAIERSL